MLLLRSVLKVTDGFSHSVSRIRTVDFFFLIQVFITLVRLNSRDRRFIFIEIFINHQDKSKSAYGR